MDDNYVYAGGAKRSGLVPYFSKIPYAALEQEAESWTEGSIKYDDEPIYEHNWRKGDATFAKACYDHAIRHIYLALAGDTSENHLANARCNLGMAIWFREQGVYDPANPPAPVERKEEEKQDGLFNNFKAVLERMGVKS